MQARRGGGNRPFMGGKQGLIIVAVGLVPGPMGGDIGRQGHAAPLGNRAVEFGARAVEHKHHLAAIGLFNHPRRQAVLRLRRVEQHGFIDMQLFGGFDKGAPAIQPLALVQRHSHAGLMPVPDPHSDQTGGNDLCVIGHHHITGAQKPRQIGNGAVLQPVRLDNQHAGRITRGRRTQRNPAVGQFKIEQFDIHRRDLPSKPARHHARQAIKRLKIIHFATVDFKPTRHIL